jgi:hypothetical protein
LLTRLLGSPAELQRSEVTTSRARGLWTHRGTTGRQPNQHDGRPAQPANASWTVCVDGRPKNEDGGDPAGVLIRVNERRSLDAIAALPTDRERGIGFLYLDRFARALSSQPCGEVIGGVEQPGIAGFGGEQDQLTDGDDAAVVRATVTESL